MGSGSHPMKMWFYQSVFYRKRVWCWMLLAFILMVKLMVMRNEYCFQSKDKLESLLLSIHDAMDECQAEYWLDFGTLLGSIREGVVLEHEYDIDLAIPVSSLDVLTKKKDIFIKHGLTLYTRGEYIPSKAKITYDTVEGKLVYSSPYIHSPCLRIYAPTGYFSDVYCYNYLPIAAAKTRVETGDFIRLPKFNKFGEKFNISSPDVTDLVCSDTCIYKDKDEHESCQLSVNVYPLSQVSLIGKKFPAPHKPVSYLRETYGDGWKVPSTKGARGPICYLHA
eukprot:TRINITY_DN15488_c0_g1_i1.p1 TRINITY_DN15488_c0_g1~~TRINITY_DN15488_c0_g1_i1.p1  ORF type:complete len:300 (+),score=68.99 TRINITY_DN15488_c0_g1_i1:64-900(+)